MKQIFFVFPQMNEGGMTEVEDHHLAALKE